MSEEEWALTCLAGRIAKSRDASDCLTTKWISLYGKDATFEGKALKRKYGPSHPSLSYSHSSKLHTRMETFSGNTE